MAVNKVTYGGRVLIDLSGDTLNSANSLLSGVTAHTKSGAKITGTNKGYSAGYTAGFAAGQSEMLYDLMPTICQANTEPTSPNVAYGMNSFKMYAYDAFKSFDAITVTGVDWSIDDIFGYGIVSSSFTCVLSLSNYNTMLSLLVYVKAEVSYYVGSTQYRGTVYKKVLMNPDEDMSVNIVYDEYLSGGTEPIVWKITIEGLRYTKDDE